MKNTLKNNKQADYSKRVQSSSTLRIILFLFLLAIISSGVTLIARSLIQVNNAGITIAHLSLNASMQVHKGIVGLDADPDGLRFGIIPPGGSSERQFDILLNESAFNASNIYVVIKSSGDISRFISFNNTNITGANSTMTAIVSVPFDSQDGNYTGRVDIFLIKRYTT